MIIQTTLCLSAKAQGKESDIDSIYYNIAASVTIDSIFISASAQKLAVADFIKLVLEDESFYKAFKRLRTTSYDFTNHLVFYDEDDSIKASFDGDATQYVVDSCRTMKMHNENVTGDFYKNERYNYYTTRLYDRIFITHDTVCEHKKTTKTKTSKGKLEYHIGMLKRLIFSPGVEADLPLVGKKMAIFSEAMRKYYNYNITEQEWNGIPSYAFEVILKPEFVQKKKKKTIIKSLNTFFSKEDLQILARSYRLKYKNALYDFDVSMWIELQKWNGDYIAKYIKYDGYWDLLMKAPEIAEFEVELDNFR